MHLPLNKQRLRYTFNSLLRSSLGSFTTTIIARETFLQFSFEILLDNEWRVLMRSFARLQFSFEILGSRMPKALGKVKLSFNSPLRSSSPNFDWAMTAFVVCLQFSFEILPSTLQATVYTLTNKIAPSILFWDPLVVTSTSGGLAYWASAFNSLLRSS